MKSPTSRRLRLAACASPALLAVLLVAGCQQPTEKAAAPAEATVAAPLAEAKPALPFLTYTTPMRSEEVSLRIPAADPGGTGYEAETEFLVKMNMGESLVYSWATEGAPEGGFYYELHGQDPANPDKVVAAFEKKMETKGSGAFTVTTPGHYGWFFQNQSDKPITVKLKIAGFYEPVQAAR